MRFLTTRMANRRNPGLVYLKIAEWLLISLVLSFIYPFFLVISGIDPTLPLDLQSEMKLVYALQMILPFICIGVGVIYRGPQLFLSFPVIIIVYPVICIASTLWSVNAYDTFKFSFLFLLYILSIASICSILDIEVVCKIIAKILLFLILASVVMALAFPKYGTHQLVDSFESIHVGMWRGVYRHKNELGAAASISLFVFLFFPRLMSVSSGLRLTGVVAALACLIFAHSSGALLGFCVLLVYHFVTRSVHFSGGLLVLVFFVMSAATFVGFGYFGGELVSAVGRDATLTGRTAIWPVVLDTIWQSPIFGFGYYSATIDFLRPILMNEVGPAVVDPHNGYLEVLLATELAGLALLMASVVLAAISGVNQAQATSGARKDCFMLLVSIPILSLFVGFYEVSAFGVESTLGALTFLSMTAMPVYLKRQRHAAGAGRLAAAEPRGRSARSNRFDGNANRQFNRT